VANKAVLMRQSEFHFLFLRGTLSVIVSLIGLLVITFRGDGDHQWHIHSPRFARQLLPVCTGQLNSSSRCDEALPTTDMLDVLLHEEMDDEFAVPLFGIENYLRIPDADDATLLSCLLLFLSRSSCFDFRSSHIKSLGRLPASIASD
jgi:hypothetical protein